MVQLTGGMAPPSPRACVGAPPDALDHPGDSGASGRHGLPLLAGRRYRLRTYFSTPIAVALDELGCLLGHQIFLATTTGCAYIGSWIVGLGQVLAMRIEGTGSKRLPDSLNTCAGKVCWSSRSNNPIGVLDHKTGMF